MLISLFSLLKYDRPRSLGETVLSATSNLFYLGGARATAIKHDKVKLEDDNTSAQAITLKVAVYILLFPIIVPILAVHVMLRSWYRFKIIASTISPHISPAATSSTQIETKGAKDKETPIILSKSYLQSINGIHGLTVEIKDHQVRLRLSCVHAHWLDFPKINKKIKELNALFGKENVVVSVSIRYDFNYELKNFLKKNQKNIKEIYLNGVTFFLDSFSRDMLRLLTSCSNLSTLSMKSCRMSDLEFPELPTSLISLKYSSCKGLQQLPVLPKTLKELIITGGKKLKKLPDLPDGLTHLECSITGVEELPALPKGLIHLDCKHSSLRNSRPSSPKHCKTLTGETVRTLLQSKKKMHLQRSLRKT